MLLSTSTAVLGAWQEQLHTLLARAPLSCGTDAMGRTRPSRGLGWVPDPKNAVWREWEGQKWHHSVQLSSWPAPGLLPWPEHAFTPLPIPSFTHSWDREPKKPKKAPGPILLPSPWHISSQARVSRRQEAEGSSRDTRMQGPAAGISGDSQSLATSK